MDKKTKLLADSKSKATAFMREHFHRNFKDMAGYTALEEFVAFIYRTTNSVEDYDELKEDALIVTLSKVKGRRFLEELGENTVVEDTQDVILSIKELLRASGKGQRVDDFICSTVFKD